MCGGPAMVIEGCGGYGEPHMSVHGLGWVWRGAWNIPGGPGTDLEGLRS